MSHEYRPLATSDSTATSLSMSSSKYSMAVFTEIPDSYHVTTLESVITCRLYCAIELTEEDVLIVCKVNDQKRPIITKKLLELIGEDLLENNDYGERSLKMEISEEVLDQLSEDEFYQYVCLRRRIGGEVEEEVFGASVPFQFKKTAEEDEEEEDFLVVRSEEHCLREQIGKLAEMRRELQTGSEELRRELMDKERQLEEVVRERDQLLEEKERAVVAMDQLRDDNKTISGQLSEQLVRSEELAKELMEMKNERQVMDGKIREQRREVEELFGKLSLLEAKEEVLRTSLAQELSEKRDLEEELSLLRHRVSSGDQLSRELEQKRQMLAEELLQEEKTRLKLKVQMKVLQEQLEVMDEDSKKKAEEHEREMREMRGRLESAADEYRHVFRTCEELRAKKQKLKEKIQRKHVENSRAQSVAAEHVTTTRVKAVHSTDERRATRAEDEEVMRLPCVVCSEHVLGRPALVQHLEQKHAQRLCPLCALPFDTRVSGHEQYLQMHVQNHLDHK